MSDPEPTPAPAAEPTPAPPPPSYSVDPYGALPALSGPGSVKVRSPLSVILLSIVTLGIYHLYWTYQVFRELKETTRVGIGPILGLVIGILISVVNWFVLPAEIGAMYERSGRPKRVSGLTGFWPFLPIIGGIVWVVKVQHALNDEWERLGA